MSTLSRAEEDEILKARCCTPLPTLLSLALVLITIDVPLSITDTIVLQKQEPFIVSQTLGYSSVAMKLMALVVLCIHCGRRVLCRQKGKFALFRLYSTSHILQLLFCSAYMTSAILGLYWQVSLHCLKAKNYELLDVHDKTNQTAIYNYQILFRSICIMLAPLLFGVVFVDALKDIIWVWWIVSLFALVFTAVSTGTWSYLLITLLYLGESALIFHCNNVNTKFFAMKEQILYKRQDEEMAAQDYNMKHIVANLAHDLKTPLSSFMVGSDVALNLTSDLLSQFENSVSSKEIAMTLKSIKGALCHMSSINTFMVMTINRCIDYTKASAGLKLRPKYETVNLLETLYLSFHCAKSVSNRVNIVLYPLPINICSHVITDKQWLQENVLCLLSNAVKYSHAGTVTLRVSLVNDRPEDHPALPCQSDLSNKHQSGRRLGSKSSTVLPLRSTSVSGESILLSVVSQDANGSNTSRESDTNPCFIRVEVEDEGIGMSEEVMSQLFAPFKQSQSLAGGTGLGLFSLSKRSEALHGQCGVMKRRDGRNGSSFWFTLPYRPDKETAALQCSFLELTEDVSLIPYPDSNLSRIPSAMFSSLGQSGGFLMTNDETEVGDTKHKVRVGSIDESTTYSAFTNTAEFPRTQTNSACDSGSSKQRVLLVDDSAMILKFTSMLLIKAGYLVDCAENGAEALQFVQSHPLSHYSVILMDLQMPIMDGIETVRRLRQWEQNLFSVDSSATLPAIIGLSANIDDDTQSVVKTSGFNAFLPKPFSMKVFQDSLASLSVL